MIAIDPKLDLVLEREVDVPKKLVWAAWTTPEHIKKWFTPAPWTTPECEIDLRPGGIFRFTMRSPEGDESDYRGCFLEIAPEERLVWTLALGPGYRPAARDTAVCDGTDLPFTAVITLEATGTGTKYRAVVMHADQATAAKHADMGFSAGWGAAFDQLVTLLKTL
jgi:uncharacterized protein YndB with AHSA1/START domain